MSVRPEIPRKNLTELGLADLQALFAEWGEPKFRAKQVYQWVFQKGARSIDGMTNLPKALRQRLSDEGYSVGRVRVGRVAESIDSTRKLAIKLDDGAAVETVLIPMGDGKFSQCLSSQVGCALDCQFCYTGTLGLSRHLTPGEIVDQVLVARDHLPEGARVTHLVYMGMGEPLHNFDGVIGSLERICDPEGLGYSHRKVTVSTSGLVPQIEKLGQTVPVNLALSLNASNDEVRDRIMPVNKRWPIATLMKALRAYPLPPRRKMTVEYVLLGGVNDSDADARRLAELVRGMPVRINLIPWNPFQGPGFDRPADDRVQSFHQILDRQGLTVTVRVTKGLDIDAACGQLGERPTAA
ncbi:MAG: 23S rRNA (adenine(2503)-C(2))-methyltransferase RlmN [Myxococcales bacterium]|nr:23S rRNA (adenine(2503)-C(2))-methyltransferase RlmN [Myxococcales bacterium]